MTDLLEDLALYLVETDICDSYGEDVFVHYKPATPDNLVSLIEYGGAPTTPFTEGGVRRVQILARNTNNEEARIRIWKIYATLIHKDNPIKYFNTRWSTIRANSLPIRIGQDEANRHEWVFNLSIITNLDI